MDTPTVDAFTATTVFTFILRYRYPFKMTYFPLKNLSGFGIWNKLPEFKVRINWVIQIIVANQL